MSNVINFPTKIGSDYFKVTSSSKPSFSKQVIERAREIRDERWDMVSARRKLEIVMNKGFSDYIEHDRVLYSHVDVCNNMGLFLDDAYQAALLMEHGERYFK